MARGTTKGLRIIGAGIGRTGTTSLEAALKQLGFDPCYTLTDVVRHPKSEPLWRDALAGKLRDWDAIFGDYQVTLESPGCSFVPELMAFYPDAKVILTVRDPDRWYESVKGTLYRRYRALASPVGSAAIMFFPHIRRAGRWSKAFIWHGLFADQFADKQHTIDLFNRHNAMIKATVPADRLLVYDVKDGWAPLCAFLGVPVPVGKPFPHQNSSGAFQRRNARAVGALVLAVAAVGLLVWKAL